ncbi:MAG: ribosomal RNA small subunit methyltransferase A [Planctomycetes bacterium]|nr:ribosomal RNA small subunit methyltransferase A [Planctomycetota bacterium]
MPRPGAPSTLPARLKAAGIRPNRILGQNFLCDGNMLEAIVREAEVETGDVVLEVGCGPGNLTARLAASARRVLAVERDPPLAAFARNALKPCPNARVLEGDALDGTGESLSTPLLSALGEEREWLCVSNLPYGAGARIVLALLDSGIPFRRLVVLLQEEVGGRLTAAPGSGAHGALSLRAAWYARVEKIRRVPPSVFWPAPKVRSTLLRVTPHGAPPTRAFGFAEWSAGLDALFRHPRKQLARGLVLASDGALDLAFARTFLGRLGIEPERRAENLALDEACRLVEAARGEAALAGAFGGRQPSAG